MNAKKIIMLCSIAIIYFFVYPTIIILNLVELIKVQYGDGYFMDVNQNLNIAPIKLILLRKSEKSCHNLFSKKYPIYFWKGNCFYIERIDSNYQLQYLNLLKKEEDSFEIGTDSLGKKLYFYSKVINFIEITDSSEPSIDKNLFSVITQEIDSETYLHYSTDYITGKVLVDLKLGTEKKPCDDIKKMKSLDIKKYKCENKDLDPGNTYKILDETTIKDYNKEVKDQNQKVYLYKRAYIGAPEKYAEYHDFDGLKKFAKNKVITILIFYLIFYIINPIFKKCEENEDTPAYYICQSILYILTIIFFIIKVKLLFKGIKNYKTYKNMIFSKMNHGIKNYYTNNVWFMNLDITILVFEFIFIIPLTLISIYLIVIILSVLGLLGKGVIDNISEKIKNIEKRKKRIKEIKDEIKALEKTENIPSYKINEKRLEFFKEKFKESLTCPISLEIFKDPVIAASGHTYEREYI